MTTWRDLAACLGMDTDLFYATENIGGPREGKGIPGEKEREALAKKTCAGCQVKQECLDYALDREDEYGIWGMLTPGERRERRRKAA